MTEPLRSYHAFAGIGGGILGEMLVGGIHAAAGCEIDPKRTALLRHHFGLYVDHDIKDVCSLPPGTDLLCAGFPCQDLSVAGNGAGLNGSRSGLWFDVLRLISVSAPPLVFIENSDQLRTRGLGTVLQGLAREGYDAAWTVLSAAQVGAPHRRRRMWLMARRREVPDTNAWRRQVLWEQEHQWIWGEPRTVVDRLRSVRRWPWALISANPNRDGLQGSVRTGPTPPNIDGPGVGHLSSWWSAEPKMGRVVDGHPGRVDQVSALGDSQVPLQCATAFCLLYAQLHA